MYPHHSSFFFLVSKMMVYIILIKIRCSYAFARLPETEDWLGVSITNSMVCQWSRVFRSLFVNRSAVPAPTWNVRIRIYLINGRSSLRSNLAVARDAFCSREVNRLPSGGIFRRRSVSSASVGTSSDSTFKSGKCTERGNESRGRRSRNCATGEREGWRNVAPRRWNNSNTSNLFESFEYFRPFARNITESCETSRRERLRPVLLNRDGSGLSATLANSFATLGNGFLPSICDANRAED